MQTPCCLRIVMMPARKSGGMPTVSRHVLIMRPRMRLTGATIMSSSLSQEIGSCHRVRSDSPRRMKMASLPAAVVCSKRATLAMSRYMSSSTYARSGVAIRWPLVSKMRRLTSSLIALVRRGMERGPREQHHGIWSRMVWCFDMSKASWKSHVASADWICQTASQLNGLKLAPKASPTCKNRYLSRMYKNALTTSRWCLIWQKQDLTSLAWMTMSSCG